MNKIIIIIKKELRSMFRDKKTMITMLFFPLLIPAMLMLYSYLMDVEMAEEEYNIAINFDIDTTQSTLLTECNLKTIKYNNIEEMEKEYNKGNVVAYIDYNETEEKYYIYMNNTSTDGMKAYAYIQGYFQSYNQYIGNIKLLEEDIEYEDIFSNVSYELKELEGENYLLNMIFSICFTYIIEAIVMACTNMATSATAVEKENGTLETILTFPIKSNELIEGKFLATFILSFLAGIISFVLTIVSLLVALKYSQMFNGVTLTITLNTILIGVIVCVACSIFVAGLSIALTSLSKSYKEAQSTVSVLSIVCMVPMLISMTEAKLGIYYYLVPIANHVQVLMDIFSNKFDLVNILITLISSIIYAIIVIYIIIKQYKSEKILFGV